MHPIPYHNHILDHKEDSEAVNRMAPLLKLREHQLVLDSNGLSEMHIDHSDKGLHGEYHDDRHHARHDAHASIHGVLLGFDGHVLRGSHD